MVTPYRGGFPGSYSISMDVQNIKLLSKKPYRVTWKTDGTRSDYIPYYLPTLSLSSPPLSLPISLSPPGRYLMYIRGPGEVYMIDRDNSVFKVNNISFPARKRPGDMVRFTLADGVSYHGDGVCCEIGVSLHRRWFWTRWRE